MLQRFALVVLVLAIILPISATGQESKVLLLVPEDNLNPMTLDLEIMIEANVMISTLEESGFKVDVATASGKPIEAQLTTLVSEHRFLDVNVDDYAGIILPCLNSPRKKPISPDVAAIIRKAAEQGKPIAAQEQSIVWLGDAGVLDGKQFSFIDAQVNNARIKHQLKSGIYTGKSSVVKDGNIITSGVCPASSIRYHLPDGTTRLTRVLIEEMQAKQQL